MQWPREYKLELQRLWMHFELIAGFVVPIIVMVVCYLQLLYALVYTSGRKGSTGELWFCWVGGQGNFKEPQNLLIEYI